MPRFDKLTFDFVLLAALSAWCRIENSYLGWYTDPDPRGLLGRCRWMVRWWWRPSYAPSLRSSALLPALELAALFPHRYHLHHRRLHHRHHRRQCCIDFKGNVFMSTRLSRPSVLKQNCWSRPESERTRCCIERLRANGGDVDIGEWLYWAAIQSAVGFLSVGI